MAHQVEPLQKCRIVTVSIAVPDEISETEITEEMAFLLTECGIETIDSNILDWRIEASLAKIVQAGSDPREGDIFEAPPAETVGATRKKKKD